MHLPISQLARCFEVTVNAVKNFLPEKQGGRLLIAVLEGHQ